MTCAPRNEPSPWVVHWAPHLRANGAVLDLACGSGRHARFLLDRGHRVTAVDRDAGALAALPDDPRLEVVQADLENGPWPFEGRRFDGVVVVRYLWRPLFPRLLEALAPGGVLLYETFALGQERLGRPRNPDFLLRPAELLEFALEGRLEVLAFDHGMVEEPQPARIQRLCAAAPM